MANWLDRFFGLSENATTVKRELLAGLIGFFTVVYIIAINSVILSESGMPIEYAIIATIAAAVVGALLMGFWGNAPILLVPGMGINALFSFTLVQSMGLSWQEALAVVFVSGVIFVFVAFTRFSRILSEAVPQSLKEAITVGLGLFLMLLGLEKGGLVQPGDGAILALGSFADPLVLATILTFLVAIVLFVRNVPGNFLITIVLGTVIAYFFGMIDASEMGNSGVNAQEAFAVFGSLSFSGFWTTTFWVAVFSLTMVLVFENIGLVHGQMNFIGRPEKYSRAFQATSVSAMASGFLGTSPTVASVESVSAMTAGGRTGLTALTAGFLFLSASFFIPLIKIIPDSAIAPILIIIGGLMLQNIKNLDMKDMSETFPALLIIVLIPFTYSIADGIAIGFMLYPVLKVAIGKWREVSPALYVIACLFFVNYVFHVVG